MIMNSTLSLNEAKSKTHSFIKYAHIFEKQPFLRSYLGPKILNDKKERIFPSHRKRLSKTRMNFKTKLNEKE